MSSRSFKGRRFRGAPMGSRAFRSRGVGVSRRPALLNRGRAIRYRGVNRAKLAALRQLANARTAGFLGIETKFYDTALAAAAIVSPTDASAAEVDPSATSMISTPAQGDGEQNRDGKKIVIKSVYIKGIVNLPGAETLAAPANGCRVYIALVLDTQSNAAQMNSEDCFKNTNAAALSAASPQRNLLHGSRFRILKDWTLDLNPQTLSHFAVDSFSHSGIHRQFEGYLNLNLPVNFNATTPTVTTIASVVDNSLHMIAYTSNNTNAPTISYNARIRFQG